MTVAAVALLTPAREYGGVFSAHHPGCRAISRGSAARRGPSSADQHSEARLAGARSRARIEPADIFEQQYPTFEILFAVRDVNDPAITVVKKLCSEYPRVPSRLLITGEAPYSNAKVFSLDRMLAAASNDLVVMSDSDTRVTPALLTAIAGEFQDARVGVATCPYRAVGGPSIWSKLEATGMNTDFMAGILVARMLEGMKFAVGPTIAARRLVLESIGGFERLKDYLAEDFAMGKFAAEAGHGVVLSSYVIEHHIGSSNWRQNAAHRLRWVRSTRRSRPVGYVGQLFTMATPVALLSCAIAPRLWLAAMGVVIIRAVAAYAVASRVLRARINWALLGAAWKIY